MLWNGRILWWFRRKYNRKVAVNAPSKKEDNSEGKQIAHDPDPVITEKHSTMDADNKNADSYCIDCHMPICMFLLIFPKYLVLFWFSSLSYSFWTLEDLATLQTGRRSRSWEIYRPGPTSDGKLFGLCEFHLQRSLDDSSRASQLSDCIFSLFSITSSICSTELDF